MDAASLDTWTIVTQLLAGLALFLFGLDQLTETLKAVAGVRMRDLLARVTSNRFKGALAGGFTTAVIQSSSVTTVLVVGFVSAGLMSVQQSVAVIMGAEIGTTITAQIIAFKITEYSLIALIGGFFVRLFVPSERVKRYGTMVFGLGLVFFGMHMMGEATYPLRSYQPFVDALARMDSAVLAILASASFTALIQSSSATTAVIIVLGSQGLITLEQGIALVFGANIGTCVTALLAAIGRQRPAVRAALVHVTFNVCGVLIWFNFIDELAQVARMLAPVDMPRQIANAHTLFNVGNTTLFIGFTGAFTWFVTKLVPDVRPTGPVEIKPRYLDKKLLETPAVALDASRMEIVRMATHVLPMVREAAPAVIRGSASDLDRIEKLDHDVDVLHHAIVKYLGKLSRQKLTERETDAVQKYLAVATYYENVGDSVETGLVYNGRQRLQRNLTIGPRTTALILSLAERVVWALQTATDAVDARDVGLADKVVRAKNDIATMADEIASHLVNRLVADAPHRTSTFEIESQLVEQYKRIYYFAKRIARFVVETDTPKKMKEKKEKEEKKKDKKEDD